LKSEGGGAYARFTSKKHTKYASNARVGKRQIAVSYKDMLGNL